MPTVRRFLIASSLARLVRKERSADRITEGYFPNQAGRSTHVQVTRDKGYLILATAGSGGEPVEERTEVPRAHAAALLDVAARKVDYARSQLTVGSYEIHLDRYVTPGPLDLLSVEFASADEALAFHPPLWVGPEVSQESAYHSRALALEGMPKIPDVPLSNAALDSLLDALENRVRPTRTTEPAAHTERSSARPVKRAPSTHPGVPPAAVEVGEDVVRELARALRPATR